MRIASLLPSATEMVHFAGASQYLVGVTHECDFPGGVEKLPSLTASKIDPHLTSREIDDAVTRLSDNESIYSLDVDLLERLAPDLVVTQGLCEVCAVSMSVVERAINTLDIPPEILSLNPTSLEDVLNDTLKVGEAVGTSRQTSREISLLRERIAGIRDAVSGSEPVRVGCIEWLDPPFSAGHWVPEMVSLAGGEDVFSAPGEVSRRMEWEEVLEAAPDVLVLMPCGFDVARAMEETSGLADVPGWQEIPAVKNDNVWVVDANSYFSRPAPRLVDGAGILADILHPDATRKRPSPRAAVKLAPQHTAPRS